MGDQLPFLICALGVAVLFYLHREKSIKTSKALWLSIAWIGLAGSRGVSGWFESSSHATLEGTLDGSPMDAAVYGLLLIIGICVLVSRRKRALAYFAIMGPVLAYSLYCLVSVSWAPYALPAFKRWIKDVGDVVMVLIVATDPQPLEALRRLCSRVGFLLFPLSIMLIRYSTLGRAWDAEGNLSIVGVTTNKNMLGLIIFVISLGVFWNFRWLLVNKHLPNRTRRLVAESILLVFGIILLKWAHSSTSLACFLLGSGLVLITHLRAFNRYPARVHILCVSIVLIGGCALFFGGIGDVAGALGRDGNLSGRTFMWAAMFASVTNPFIGVGFDSFWTSPNAATFHDNLNLLHWYHAEGINEAHNGYIEAYLNLGWVGICLIAMVLVTGYWSACKAFKHTPEFASVLLAYIITGSIYSITEAGFRTLNPMWFFILLAVVSAGGANAHLLGEERRIVRRSRSNSRSIYQRA